MTEEKEQRIEERKRLMGKKGRVNSVIHVENGKETKFVITNYCRLL